MTEETLMARCLRLEAELAEVKAQRDTFEQNYVLEQDDTRELREELAATQADNERLREALLVAQKFCNSLTAEECPDTVAIPINEALSRPINLDALNELRSDAQTGASDCETAIRAIDVQKLFNNKEN